MATELGKAYVQIIPSAKGIFLWLRRFITRDVSVKSWKWRLVTMAHCSPPGCLGSHIQSIWQILGQYLWLLTES